MKKKIDMYTLNIYRWINSWKYKLLARQMEKVSQIDKWMDNQMEGGGNDNYILMDRQIGEHVWSILPLN